MIEAVGGRKFAFAVLASISVLILTILQTITPQEFIDFLKFIGVTYVAGNVVSKVTEKIA